MPLYEYRWRETRELVTRISVPNDDLALVAAQTDEFKRLALADEAPIIAPEVAQIEVLLVGRVVSVADGTTEVRPL